MRLKRKTGVGIHRLRVPKHGWVTVRPGEELPGEHDNIDFLGNQKESYYAISGKMPEPEKEPEEPSIDFAMIPKKVDGGWNVINSRTSKAINKNPLTKKDALKLLGITDKECPLKEGEFGNDFDEFEQCKECINKDNCQKVS